MDRIDYIVQIKGFLEEFILTTGQRPLFVSFNNDTYEKVCLQCQERYMLPKPLKMEEVSSVSGFPIQISPSLKDGVIVFIGGEGFLNRCYQVFDSTVSKPTIKFRQIELEEE